MRMLIIGPQGAGKGTQATMLSATYQIPHVSTGDLFRAHTTGGTALGRTAARYMDAGELVPDEVTQEMLAARLADADAANGFLLDGFPRSVPQARWLAELLEERGHPLDLVVVLDAAEEVVVERMLARGRPDDNPDAIARRLALYHRETTPVLEHYADFLVTVDGVGPVGDVHQRIVAAISDR